FYHTNTHYHMPYMLLVLLHPKPPHQYPKRLLGCCTPNLLTSILIGLLGCCTQNHLRKLPIELLGCCTPNYLRYIPIGLLGCCTPNLLTSIQIRLLGCSTSTQHTILNNVYVRDTLRE